MNQELWRSVEEHFHQTLDLTGEEQKIYIEKLKERYPEVGNEVEKLLDSHNSSDTFLTSDVLADHEIASGTRIHQWRILRQIGEGGMSTVYLAERADGQFDRKVAVKLLHGIMPGQTMHRRILQEQQILARLQHPYIAQLFDAGITDEGRPYFILEYVEGAPVTQWCNDRQLDLNKRLNIFIQVCEAVQYAHQKLIVHRDLKPSNILVGSDGTVKLLDFGIAKIVEDESGEGLPHTHTAAQMMTPEYASPEQISGDPITTATDVYALGLLLCELLTGMLPYAFYDRTPFEIARVITDTLPARPSSLVTRKAEDVQTDIQMAGIHVSNLRKKLKGDLDNIILKALRKDPARRYGSAEQMLKDIHNYLNNLPVSARPESFGYKTAKFIVRHRVGVFAALVVAISLVATTGVSLWQAEQARLERDRTQKINEFLQTILTEADPYEAGADATIRDVLRKADHLIKEQFTGQPDIEAPLRYTIGYTQLSLMELEASLQNLQRSEELFRQLYGPHDQRTLEALAYQYWLQFRKGDYDSAIEGYRSVLSTLQPGHSWDFRARLLNDFGVILSDTERYEEAMPIQHQVLELWQNNDPERPELAIAFTNLGHTMHGLRQYEEAEYYYRESLRLHRQHYPDGLNPDLAMVINNLGVLLRDMENYDEALPLYEESLMIRQLTLGREHTFTGLAHLNIGRLLLEMDQMEESREHLYLSKKLFDESLGNTHLYTLVSHSTIGYIHSLDGNMEEAVRMLTNSLTLMQENSAPAWVIEQTTEWLENARSQHQ